MWRTYQFQVKSGSPGPLMLTHIVHHIFQMARPTNFKLGVRMEDNDLHQPQAPWLPRVKVTRSRDQSEPCWAQWPINRKRVVVVSSKLAGGDPMTRATLRTSFKVKRSKVRVTGRLTQTHKMCHIFWTVRPKNFNVGVRMEDVDPHQRQVPWPPRLNVKVKVTWYI